MKLQLSLFHESTYKDVKLPRHTAGVGIGDHAEDGSGHYRVAKIQKVYLSYGSIHVLATPCDDDENFPAVKVEATTPVPIEG